MAPSYVEPKQYDIPVLYHVVLSFHAHHTLVPGSRKRPKLNEVFISYYLSLYESSFKVCVDLSRSPGSLRAFGDGPGPAVRNEISPRRE